MRWPSAPPPPRQSLGLRAEPVFTYLANSIRANGREIPYSVVTALDPRPPPPAADDGITLNQWAARDLKREARRRRHARLLRLEIRRPPAHRHARSSASRRSCPSKARRPTATTRPTIRASPNPTACTIGIRPSRSTCTACAPSTSSIGSNTAPRRRLSSPLARGQQLWGTRFGKLTSIRISPPSPAYAAALRAALDPAQMGLTVIPVRARRAWKPRKAPPISASTSSTSASS